MPSPFEDCVIAAENIMLGAQSFELGGTYIGYLVKAWEHSKYDKELIKWVKRHNWDSLEKDKDLILRHLRTFTG